MFVTYGNIVSCIIEGDWHECFVECSQLSDIHFNTSLETIGKGAFSGCGLTSLDMSGLNALQTVKSRRFRLCKLSVLVLPDHVVSLLRVHFRDVFH